MTNADKFKEIFGLYATEVWAKTEKDFLEWLNEDVPDTNDGDTISRQDAIGIFTQLWDCIGTIMDKDEWEDVCRTTANELPSATETHETHGVCLDDLIKRTDAIKALDDILRVFIDLGLSCAYDMPSFWYNEKKNYKVIPTKYHIGYQQALKDSEQKIKKIMEKLCYG